MQALKSMSLLCRNLRPSLGPSEPSSKVSIQLGGTLAPKFKVRYQFAVNPALLCISLQDFTSEFFHKGVRVFHPSKCCKYKNLPCSTSYVNLCPKIPQGNVQS